MSRMSRKRCEWEVSQGGKEEMENMHNEGKRRLKDGENGDKERRRKRMRSYKM